ncbi:calcium-binding protein [Paracoccus nototheniae]|uniref:Calcium-binding protein n=1 Tax=Paracoccus nototheniae TaxID=2489002 RepID=A0ABW4DU23_9RHOB|nr:hypothetical protein [Paracoccus nototheniae]
MAIIRGSNRGDSLTGTSRNDVVWGLDGDDSFYWSGGRGNDTYHGGDRGERYDSNPYTPGNPGGDRLFLDGSSGASVSFLTTENGTARIGGNLLNFTGIERLFGTDSKDVIDGRLALPNPSHDGTPTHGLSIFSGGGNDKIFGSRYDDVIDGGPGNDQIRAGGGNDFIHSSTGNDRIWGGAGDENIRWGNGDNQHNPGHDRIWGGAGNDLINIWIKDGDVWPSNEERGIRGVEVDITRVRADGSFSGTAETNIGGDASLRFDGFELAWTHAGNDTFDASDARVVGDRGVNLNARWGHDVLIGSSGNDTLDGSEGRDTLRGGQGDDELWVGDGRNGDGDRDTLIFRRGDGQDTVYGFDAGLDVLDLGGRDYSAREINQGTLLDFGRGDTVLLSGEFDFI